MRLPLCFLLKKPQADWLAWGTGYVVHYFFSSSLLRNGWLSFMAKINANSDAPNHLSSRCILYNATTTRLAQANCSLRHSSRVMS